MAAGPVWSSRHGVLGTFPRLPIVDRRLVPEVLSVAVENKPRTLVAKRHVLELSSRAVIVVNGAIDLANVDLGVSDMMVLGQTRGRSSNQ
jgi:hypothetical protein